jgi:hypothetical protein
MLQKGMFSELSYGKSARYRLAEIYQFLTHLFLTKSEKLSILLKNKGVIIR